MDEIARLNYAELESAASRIDAGIQAVRESGAELAEQTARRDAAEAKLADAKRKGKDARQAFRDACAQRDIRRK
jgi:hypothetical protein